jgi:hypothetical protein
MKPLTSTKTRRQNCQSLRVRSSPHLSSSLESPGAPAIHRLHRPANQRHCLNRNQNLSLSHWFET